GADEDLSDGGPLRVIVFGYDVLPMLPVAPPSPDYIPGLEEPQTLPAPQDEDEHKPMFIQPHDPDFVLKPIYPEYIPLEDEHILSAEEQPLPHYEDDETEDGPVDYPMDEGDDGDDDDGDSSGDDADDEYEDMDDEDKEDEEEEEHIAPADSTTFVPPIELVSSHEGTEPIIPPPFTDIATTGARITIRLQTSTSLPPAAEVERLLAMPPPLPSPLTSLSPPSAGSALVDAVTAALPSPPLPPSLYPPPPVDRRDDVPESEQPPRKRAEMRHRDIREVGYGIRDTWIDPIEADPEMAPTTLEEVNTRVIELAELDEHDTQDLYAPLEDARDDQDPRSRGLCNDLGSAQEENDGQFVANENKKIDKYISGLPDSIYGNVKSSKPRTMDETIELINDLMDQKLRTYAQRSDSKRKADDTSRSNHGHQ
nr:hypothetical protein [Tanacetum cinerariifolium]